MCHFSLHLTEEFYDTLQDELQYTKTQARILSLHGRFIEMENPDNLIDYARANASALF